MSKQDHNNKFDPNKISIIEFKMIKGQVENSEEFSIDKVEGHYIDNELTLGFNLEEKLIKADYTVNIRTESNGANNIEATGNFHLMYTFKVENMEDLTTNENKNIDIDFALAHSIVSISYSTSRGILLTRLQGTSLQKFILPIIDPKQLMGENNNTLDKK